MLKEANEFVSSSLYPMHRLSISVDDEFPICTFLHILQENCCFNNFTCLTISSNQISQQITNRKKQIPRFWIAWLIPFCYTMPKMIVADYIIHKFPSYGKVEKCSRIFYLNYINNINLHFLKISLTEQFHMIEKSF